MNLPEFLRFAIVGVLQNGANLASFAGLVTIGVDFRIAAVIAGAVGLVMSFALNRSWTFVHASHHRLSSQALRYTAIFIAATLAGIAVLWVLVTMASVPEIAAQAVAILIVAPLSYAAQRRWSFGLMTKGGAV